MKNKFFIFITAIICFFIASSQISAHANETLDYGLRNIRMQEKYNYFVFADTAEELDKTNFSIYYEGSFDDVFYNEIYTYYVNLVNSKGAEYRMECTYEFEEEYLKSVLYKLDNEVIYNARFNGHELVDVICAETIYVNEITGIEDDYFIVSECVHHGNPDVSIELTEINNIAFAIGNCYVKNDVYQGKDVYFLSLFNEPISLDTIKSYLTANDDTDGNVTNNIEIYNNTYIVDENLKVGKYSFDAYVRDDYGNVTYQRCYVMVVDFEKPTITGEDLEVSYQGKKKEADLIKQFTAQDNNGDCIIEIIEDNYSDNYNKPGKYTVTAQATDLDGNTATATITVTVIDNRYPEFSIYISELELTTLDNYSEADFLKHFVAMDKIDGENVTMWVEDLDGYFLNTRKAGKYSFIVYAEDQSGNSSHKNLYVEVIDRDFPSIEIDSTYSIIIPSDTLLTKEQVKEYFNNLSILTEDVIDVESEYFNTSSPEGEYDMLLSMGDGSIIQSKIIIQKQDIEYTPENNSNFSAVYIGAAIIGIMALIAGCLAFVRLKKKR